MRPRHVPLADAWGAHALTIAFIKQEKEQKKRTIPKDYARFAKLFEELDNDYYLPEHKL